MQESSKWSGIRKMAGGLNRRITQRSSPLTPPQLKYFKKF